MKIDTSKARKSSLEVPPDCLELIERLCRCTWSEVLIELKKIDTWTYGKCELYHWVKVLDYFDGILESAAGRIGEHPRASQSWHLRLDNPENEELKELVIWVLHFTTLLIEHSFSRHMYNSVEHLLVLLSSCNLEVVLAVLNLLYMFSKRSNFIIRLKPSMRDALLKCLTYLAESWGGRENGFGLADCCRDNPSYCPSTATTLHYEFYTEEEKSGKSNQVSCIHIENVDKLDRTAAEIMNSLLDVWKVPLDGQMSLFTHVRLAYSFSNYQLRLQCVQARLQSLSILLYNHSFIEIHNLLYTGLLDELVELLELNDPKIIEIKAAALRTLTSIIHLDRNPRSPLKPGSRLNMIIDVTGASLYHGFLPQMVRNCISSLTGARNNELVPLPLATALFSFLYHLSSYEPGSEALVNCGMMESLLKIVNWPGKELEHITFVTRAVRVIDLITNMDMQAFQVHGGMNSFIDRLEMEIKICRTEQPFEIVPTSVVADAELDEEMNKINVDSDSSSHSQPGGSASTSTAVAETTRPTRGKGQQKTCLTQRAALLKSMLNFMKKALQDVTIHQTIRHVMDGSLPSSLKHIISNAEYYGPSLFLLATDVVTAYVFQEPTLLSSLQENGLTDVVLHALLVKDVPATREVLGSLPNVFSALCLNPRGLTSFVRCRPFDKLFKVLISPVYLSAMRNRRSVNGDTATNLGNAMDELMRHQPTLKAEATSAIIRLLEALCRLGTDPRYICWRAQKGGACNESPLPLPLAARVPREEVAGAGAGAAAGGGAGAVGGGGGSSDEEDDDEEEASTSTPSRDHDAAPHETTSSQNASEKTPIALIDYISNVMKFIDAILSNNSTEDHCREFINQGGLDPLLSVLGLPNLPVDYPSTVLASQSVASVCKSILNLTNAPKVMEVALTQLNEVLQTLGPLLAKRESLEGSILLHELATASNLETAIVTPSATPLLHAVAAVNSYVIMFVNVCRTAQTEIRQTALLNWGSELGLKVLNQLCHLYSSSLWESTILLALCSDDASTASRFSREDVERLFPSEMSIVEEENSANTSMESEPMDVDEQPTRPMAKKKIIPPVIQLKYIKPILASSSRLGRGLAELFGLLVKLCVGSPTRTRRAHHQTDTHSNREAGVAARRISKTVAALLIRGIHPDQLPKTPLPKFALTYLICSLGFTTPLMFDDKKLPYHLMLYNFMYADGLDTLFKVLLWALTAGGTVDLNESLENLPGLPDGTDEFLDAWLIFVEKLANPKTVFDMAHFTSGVDLDHIYYTIHLNRLHMLTFMALKKLWGRRVLPTSNWTYWPRIVETMLILFKLVLCGDRVLEKKQKEEEAASVLSSRPGQAGNSEVRRREQQQNHHHHHHHHHQQQQQQPRPEVNVSDLQQLMDMGFLRDHCYEALILTSTMEHATDYLLNNFFPYSARNSQPSMDTEDEAYFSSAISLDDQAESLGTSSGLNERFRNAAQNSENDPVSQNAGTQDIGAGNASSGNTDVDVPIWKGLPEFWDETHIKDLLDNFSESVVPYCLDILEDIPEYAQHDIVYHMSELIKCSLLRRRTNGKAFAVQVLTSLAKEIIRKMQDLTTKLIPLNKSVTNTEDKDKTELDINTVFISPESSHTASIITLFTLIFEELRIPGARVVHLEDGKILKEAVDLLKLGADILSKWKLLITPRWLASILQFLDLCEKVSDATKRKSTMHKNTTDVWKWFDLSSGKWILYSHSNNRAINEKYWGGYSVAKINSGRRYYNIAFQHMMQTNEESGKARPVMRSFIAKKDLDNAEQADATKGQNGRTSGDHHDDDDDDDDDSYPETLSFGVDFNETRLFDEYFCQPRRNIVPVDGIPEEHIKTLISACVSLLNSTDNKETLQAALVMCVRFTRKFETASYVAEMGVVKTLLSLKSSTSFPGFENLSTILIRHILEEPSTLEVAFEKVLRAKTLQNIPPSYKELYFILRECSAAICRDMSAFKKVSERILRIDIAASSKKSDDDEIRYLMKSIPTNTTNKRKKKPLQKNTEESARKTVYDLLNALVVDCDEKPKNKSKPADDKEQSASMAASHNQGFEQQRSYVNLTEHIVAIAEQQQQQRQMLANHLANIVNGFEIPTDHTFPGQNTSNIDSFVSPMNRSEKERKVRLISKSGILKILSDAVRSYNTIASLITQYSYVGNKNSLVKEDCSAIAFVLDNMLTSDEGMPDPDRPNLARGLIAAVASCNHSPDAQLALVNEVKSALQRALAMKESAKKHQHIIDLVGIVTIMIENCPPVPINSTPLTSSLKLSQFSVNNMVRFMMKKNIVIDLARISHTLDLSSPKMSTTVNAALKPLETLTRIMSCPPTTASKVKTRQSTAAAARDQPGTSTSESTNAQGEDAVEDTDNTDHDMSGPVDEESIDGRHDGITTAMRNELEDLIDRVNSDLANNEDSPMIDNDGDEHNPNRNTTEVLIFDDNSFENAEDILRRMNNHNHNDQRDGSSGEDSDSNSTEDHRMDSNDPHNEDHNDDDDAVDGEDDDGEGGEGEDEDEEEDDEEEEEEEEDEDEEDDDGDHYDNETFEMFDTEDGVLHIPGLDHESDDFLMIEFSEPTNHSTPLMPWISPAFSFPSSLLDEATHENSNGPGGSGRIPPIHPFLMSRQNLVDHRTQRLSRTRRHPMMEGGTGAGDRVPYIGAPHPHPNGHGHGSVTADIITTTLSGNNARVVVMDNGLGIFTNTEEEQISYVDQSGYLLGPSLAATLNNVPTSMHWWNEEAKLLDGDSQADASAVVGFDTTDVFVKHRADEMAERREAMKKLDEQKKKKKPEAEKKSSNQKNDYSGLMDILEASSTSSGTGAAAGGGGGGGSGPPRLAPRTRAATANVLAAAAQEVAQATENLAGSIVDSALNIARSWPSSSPPSSQSQSQRQYHDRSTPEGYYLGRDIIYSQEPSFSPQCTQENSFSPQCNQENSYSPQCTQETLEDRQERSQMDNFDEPTRFTTETTEFEYSAPSPRYEPFSSPGDEHTERVEIPILLDNQSDDQVEERPLLASNTTPVESNVIRLRRRQITISPRQSNSRSSQGESTTQESVSSQASTIILPRTRPDVVCQRPHAPTPAELRQLLADQREASRQARQAICIEWSSPHDQETPNQQQQQQQQTATESAPSSSRELAQPSELDSEGNQVMQDAVDNSEHGQTLRSTLSSPTSTDDGFSVSQLMPPESETFGEMVTVESGDVEDPLGLIPGSVPFPAQTDPDDGFFRVNRYESGQNEENSNASSPGQSPFNSRNFQQDNAAARMSTWLDSQISNSGAACSTPVTSQGTQENSSQDRTNTVLPAVPDNSAEVEQSSNNASSNLPDIPEGVDPSFLEALPEDMRAEVIQEHLRLQRMSARAEAGAGGVASTSAESSSSGSGSGSTQAANLEVNADFLNALPPNIQQEVLAQQRLEQQRQQAALANPNEPMDPTAFFQDLPANLRSSILADMEESQISVLPPELAAEAQNLRREWEARNRQLVQERFLNHVTNSSTTLSSILRNTGSRNMARQGGTQRYTIQGLPQRSQHWSGWALRQHQTAGGGTGGGAGGGGVKPNMRTRGRQILDYDSICCLLVLLFVDDSKLNTVRLHRVFRNLCYHAPTRDWIIKALLSIMEKSNEGVDSMEKTSNAGPSTHRSSKRIAARIQTVAIEQQALINIASKPAESNSWLNISMDAALGCRATVFHVIKTPGRRTGIITINYQAAPFVYRHALDLLISLAKTFPNSFVPSVTQSSSEAKPSSHNQSKKNKDGPIFWEILVRLDASFNSKKGKNTQKCITINQEIEHCSLDSAPFGQLLKMLASPVVRKSSPLMNKLLRLLSLVSSGLQASKEHETTQQVLSEDTLRHLSLVSDVLTSITCTEEGLEDATALLLNMSVKLKPIREAILKMLLDGATKMAERMNKEIETLLKEVVASLNNAAESEEKNDNNRSTSGKGILRNRFTKDTVVVSAPKKVKTGQDLQLSSMAPLISKTSSQSSFLRILKVIVQIRDSIRSVESKNKETDEENDEDDDDDDDDDEELFLLEVRGDNERQGGSKSDKNAKKKMPPLSELLKLDHLWSTLSRCLRQLDKTQDSHAVLVLQPAVEAFFIVHASSAETLARPNGNSPGPSQESSSQQQSQSSSGSSASSRVVSNELAAPPPLSPLPTDNHDADSFPQAQSTQHKFLKFAETHRTVLNQILRQCNTPLVDGPFAVLVNHTRVLDFDVKTRYFRSELERADDANRREELAVHVKRNHVFEDSFRELHRRPPEEWKNRFYIVFEGEEGQDAGGLLREWYMIISREIFNPMYALFSTSSADKVTYTINTSSHYNNNHLCYFKFVGRVIAKAIFDNKLLECYFTRSFYKHILGIPVKYTDMESEDYTFYQGLVYLMEHHISSLGYDVTFSTEVQEFGVTSVRDLLPNGRNIPVTEENKIDYIRLVCQMKMTGAIRQQLDAFLEGFYDIIPNRLISIFNEQELELLISGLPNVDIDDLKANTEYYKYQPNSLQIQWFWRALREFNQAERAKFLQFVTGTSKVPLQGFSALEGMNGIQKFQIHRDERSTDRLPSAHTCFNQLDLPVYETYTKLRTYLLKAIHECSEGFGFA